MSGLLIPRLHVVTDDAVLARPDFLPLAAEILQTLGARGALHVRAHYTPARRVFEAVEQLSRQGCCLVNDRVDIALATAAAGVQLGGRSLPADVVRDLLRPGMMLGCSVHSVAECQRGADFLMAGTIYPTATHPGRPASGIGLIRECAAVAPVIGIGGITAERAPEVMAAGAHGVAVIRAVWDAARPVQAAGEFARILYERAYDGDHQRDNQR